MYRKGSHFMKINMYILDVFKKITVRINMNIFFFKIYETKWSVLYTRIIMSHLNFDFL